MIKSMKVHLVLLETSGNQAYIFGTNRLRENVGASELTHASGSQWVREALAGRVLGAIDDGTGQVEVESVIETSGKAILMVRDLAVAHEIVEATTTKALSEAPGLDLFGVVSEPFEWFDAGTFHESLKAAFASFEELKARRPAPVERFQRLPIMASCSSSGRPASHVFGPWVADEPDDDEGMPFSAESYAKRSAAGAGYSRLRVAVEGQAGAPARLPRNMRDLERALEGRHIGEDGELRPLEWLGVLHADGNGLGQVFLGFDQYAGRDSRAYVERLRRVSTELDAACIGAFGAAARALWERTRRAGSRVPLALLPLILGGDDMTALCDGREAVRFTRDYLVAFETMANVAMAGIAMEKPMPYLTAAAGVAIVKPHFPFSSAYALSEQLLQSAKRTKTLATPKGEMCSALDFHMLYDASGSDLERIRERLGARRGKIMRHFHHRPLLVGPHADAVAQTHGVATLAGLEKRVAIACARGEDGRRSLPSSQLHALRAALFEPGDRLETVYRQMRRRYQPQLAQAVAWRANGDPAEPSTEGSTEALFSEAKEGVQRTLLLDVLESQAALGAEVDA